MFLPPPLLLLLPQDAAPNASAQTPATAKTERGFKTRIPLLNASLDTADDPILPTRAAHYGLFSKDEGRRYAPGGVRRRVENTRPRPGPGTPEGSHKAFAPG